MAISLKEEKKGDDKLGRLKGPGSTKIL